MSNPNNNVNKSWTIQKYYESMKYHCKDMQFLETISWQFTQFAQKTMDVVENVFKTKHRNKHRIKKVDRPPNNICLGAARQVDRDAWCVSQ